MSFSRRSGVATILSCYRSVTVDVAAAETRHKIECGWLVVGHDDGSSLTEEIGHFTEFGEFE